MYDCVITTEKGCKYNNDSFVFDTGAYNTGTYFMQVEQFYFESLDMLIEYIKYMPEINRDKILKALEETKRHNYKLMKL